jgi:hydrogenase nickel incorporation protein HypB
MCDACGCNVTPGNRHVAYKPVAQATTEVSVLKSLLQQNDHQAAHNRAHFDAHGILVINLMSAPGSGKTALLEATIDALKEEFRITVIEGDLETENDAERIRAKGVPAVQITTGTACHLDAHMWRVPEPAADRNCHDAYAARRLRCANRRGPSLQRRRT